MKSFRKHLKVGTQGTASLSKEGKRRPRARLRAQRISRQAAGRSRIADSALRAVRCITTVSEEGIQITASGGEVTLHGAVQTANQKKIVEEVVRYQPQVKRIVNLLRVEPDPSVRPQRLAGSETHFFRPAQGVFRELCEGSQ